MHHNHKNSREFSPWPLCLTFSSLVLFKNLNFEITTDSHAVVVRSNTERSHVLFTQFSPRGNSPENCRTISQPRYWCCQDMEHFRHHKTPSCWPFIAKLTSLSPDSLWAINLVFISIILKVMLYKVSYIGLSFFTQHNSREIHSGCYVYQ